MTTYDEIYQKMITEGNSMDWSNALNRSYAIPLERYSVFNSLSSAREYALHNAVAYEGQMITVTENGATKGYFLDSTGLSGLREVADETDIQDITALIDLSVDQIEQDIVTAGTAAVNSAVNIINKFMSETLVPYINTSDRQIYSAAVLSSKNYTDDQLTAYTTTEKLTGFTTQDNAKNYSIQLSSDGTAYVHVGWTGGSASDVAVDDDTIKKRTDGTSQIYVNQITKSKISDFPTSLSSFTNDPGYVTETTVSEIGNRVSTIESYIPNATALSNQLADKKFVNSSIATNTANFVGTFTDFDELSSTKATNNDYAFLSVGLEFRRYKYSDALSAWKYEYTLNNSSFTSDQWNAINSKITAEKVTEFSQLSGAVDKKLENYVTTDSLTGNYATKTELSGVNDKFANYTTTEKLTGFTTQESAKNYAVQLSSDGNAYVHVNWTGGSAGDVAVDDTTIKKKTDGTNQIYVNQITKSKISDFPTIPSDLSAITISQKYIRIQDFSTNNWYRIYIDNGKLTIQSE